MSLKKEGSFRLEAIGAEMVQLSASVCLSICQHPRRLFAIFRESRNIANTLAGMTRPEDVSDSIATHIATDVVGHGVERMFTFSGSRTYFFTLAIGVLHPSEDGESSAPREAKAGRRIRRFRHLAGRFSYSGDVLWNISAAIAEGVPVSVASAELYQRFISCGDADYQDKLLSAKR